MSSSKKDTILKVARELFLGKGYDATSVEDILAATSASKGGFYHHFASKERLLFALLAQENDAVVAKMEARADPDIPARQRLQLFFDSMQELKSSEHMHLLQQLLMQVDDLALRYDMSRTLWRAYAGLLGDILKQGVQESAWNVHDPAVTADLILHIVSLLNRPEQHYEADMEKLKKGVLAVEEAINALLAIPPEQKVYFVRAEYMQKIEKLIS